MILQHSLVVKKYLIAFTMLIVGISSSITASSVPVEMVGQWGGKCKAIAISGDRLYLGKGQKLMVLDVSLPDAPSVIQEMNNLPGVIEGIVILDSYAYLACSSKTGGGIQQVIIPETGLPVLSSYLALTVRLSYISAAGDRLYVAIAGGVPGFFIYRTSSEGAFWRIGGHSTEGDPTLSVIAQDNRVYITNELRGMGIWETAQDLQIDPLVYQWKARCYQSDPPYDFERPCDVMISGTYAYVADQTSGVRIINMSNPSAPFQMPQYYTDGDTQKLAMSGRYLYIANGDSGVQVLDTMNPPALSKVSDYSPGGFIGGLTLSSNRVYATGSHPGLSIIDFSDLAHPVQMSSLLDCGDAMDVSILGDYAFVASGKAGLQVINIANPTRMTRVNEFNTEGDANGIALSGNYAYIADGTKGLRVINISDPQNLVGIGSCSMYKEASDVVLANGYAYVACGLKQYDQTYGKHYYVYGFAPVDVSDPANPREEYWVHTGSRVRGMAASGNYLYIGTEGEGLLIYDISSPSSPSRVGEYRSSSGVFDIAIYDNYAYLAAGKSGLQIIDLATPSSPHFEGTFNPGNIDAQGISLNGDYAYITDADSGNPKLYMVDIRNRNYPVKEGMQTGLQYPSKVTVSGSYAFIANESAGLSAFHIGAYPPPTVNTITPKVGINTGVIHITNLTGAGFRSGTSVKLTKASQNDIQASNVSVIGDTQISCDFDLTGKAPGLWNVVVTNPDGLSADLGNSFGVVLPDTGPVYGISNHAAYDSVINNASKKWRFRLWGKVTNIDSDSFWLDDGSNKPIRVFAPGHVELSKDDYASAVGTLDISFNTVSHLISLNGVRKLSPRTGP